MPKRTTFSSAASAGRSPAKAVAAVLATKLRRVSFMSSSSYTRRKRSQPALVAFTLSAPGRAERPDQKIIANIVVNFGESKRLEQQKQDDERAVEHQRQVRAQIGGKLDAEKARDGADQIVEHDRRKQNEAGAEKASEYTAKPTDDHHGEELNRKVEMELLR